MLFPHRNVCYIANILVKASSLGFKMTEYGRLDKGSLDKLLEATVIGWLWPSASVICTSNGVQSLKNDCCSEIMVHYYLCNKWAKALFTTRKNVWKSYTNASFNV